MIAECSACGEKMPLGQLLTPDSLWKNLKPGQPEPAGECPYCGGTAYLEDY